jgi:hypothetical protein
MSKEADFKAISSRRADHEPEFDANPNFSPMITVKKVGAPAKA